MSNLNTQIKMAIESQEIVHARELLRDALKDADAETYFLASKVSVDEEQREEFLKKAISIDPFHTEARAALRKMEEPSKHPIATSVSKLGTTPIHSDDLPQRERDLLDEIRKLDIELNSSRNMTNLAWGVLLVGFLLAPVGIGVLIIIGSFYLFWKSNKDKAQITEQIYSLRRRLPELDEGGSYGVVIDDIGARKINVIKEVRALTQLGLKEAKELVESPPPIIVMSNVNKQSALDGASKFKNVGAIVRIVDSETDGAATLK